jgi:hypothetical protein
MAKYRKLPVEIEAVQWFKYGDHPAVGKCVDSHDDVYPVVVTLEGSMRVNVGDWIVRGVEGEHYPVKDEIFRKTYALVDDPPSAEVSLRDGPVE